MGFWDRVHPVACFLGMIGGIVAIVVTYAVAETWGEGFDQMVNSQGGIFNRSATYAFCLSPLASALVTLVVTLVIPGYKFAGYQVSGELIDTRLDYVQFRQWDDVRVFQHSDCSVCFCAGAEPSSRPERPVAEVDDAAKYAVSSC